MYSTFRLIVYQCETILYFITIDEYKNIILYLTAMLGTDN